MESKADPIASTRLDHTPIRADRRLGRRKLTSRSDSDTCSPFRKRKTKSLSVDKSKRSEKENAGEQYSQEVNFSPIPSDVPKVMWRTHINSPENCDVPSERTGSADQPSSTPYLDKVWSEKTSSRPSADGATSLSSFSHSAGSKGSHDWLNQMFDLVGRLEGKADSPSGKSGDLSQLATGRAADCPVSDGSTRQNIDGAPTLRQCSGTAEDDSSLFSDSMAEVTADLTFSDMDEDTTQRASGATYRPPLTPTLEKGQGHPQTKADSHSGVHVSSSTVQPSSREKLPQPTHSQCSKEKPSASAHDQRGKEKPPTPTHDQCSKEKRVEVKQEKTVANSAIKLEPSTLHTTIRSKPRGGDGPSLRRHSSHDSLINSPRDQSSEDVSNSLRNQDTTQLNIIEQKRKSALMKLKNRRSGSFVRHRSLDSVVTPSLQEKATSQKNSQQTAEKALEQLIEEKRRLAAERLQKRRYESSGNSDSHGGSFSQPTPPNSQEEDNSKNTHKSDISHSMSIKQGDSRVDSIMSKLECDTEHTGSQVATTDHRDNKPSGRSYLPSSAADPVGQQMQVQPSQRAVQTVTTQSAIDVQTQRIIEQKRQAALQRLKQSKHSVV